MKKLFSKEVQIALVAIVGIIVLFFGMKFLKGMFLFSTDDSYYVEFDDISGVSASCPVYANGYRVGVVEDVIFNYDSQDKIVAVLGLDKQLRLPKASTAEIASDLLGNVKLELKFGPNPVDVMEPGDTLYGKKQSGALGKAADMLPQIENMLLMNPAIANSLHNVDQITAHLVTTTNELNRLTASLNQQMPGTLTKVDGLLDNTTTLTKNLSELDIAMTMAKVNNTLQNVEQMTAKLNSNEGTIGLLMRDQELYRNVTSTMGHVDSLMIDLKQHPQRYVHFSLFGRKNK